MAQIVSYFTGFETGDASEIVSLAAGSSVQTGTVRTGNYALKQAGAGNPCNLKTGLGSTQTVVRFYLNPVGTGVLTPILRENATNRLRLSRNTNDTIRLDDAGVTMGLTLANTVAVTPAAAWTLVEVAWDLAAGGAIKVWINGVLDISTTHTSDVSATATNAIFTSGRANPNEYFFDDIRIDTGGVAQIGAGQSRMVQGVAGAPTYNAWTKNGAATAALCWSETPFSATNNCSDTVLNDAQTMLCGVMPGLGSTDTINAVKVAMIAKATVAGNCAIRRRVGGVDTDVTVALTTADKYFDTGIITGLTYANLTDGTTEIGAKSLLVTLSQVEDMWLMVDYTPGFRQRRSLSELGTRTGSRQMRAA